MPLAFIAGAVFAVTVAVGATVVAVAATVAAVIAPIISAVVSVVGGIVSTVGTVLGGVINVIGGIVEMVSAGLQTAVTALKTTIVEPLGNIVTGLKTAIGDVIGAITEPLAPILNPIKDSLITIKDFVVETQTWITAELAPVGELIEVVNTVSAVMFVKQLIDGTLGITEIIGEVADGNAIATAQAIVELSNNIVEISVGTLNYVHDSNVALANAIDNYDEKIREDNQIALAMLEDAMSDRVTEVANNVTQRITSIESDIVMVADGFDMKLQENISPITSSITMLARRTEDLPYFQDMLIKALS